MTAVTRVGDDLHIAASEAGVRVLDVHPSRTRPGYTMVVPRRRDAWRLRWAARFRCRSGEGEPWAVVSPMLDVLANSYTDDPDDPGCLVTVVPDGVDPWVHQGRTWWVTVRTADVPAVIARLGEGL